MSHKKPIKNLNNKPPLNTTNTNAKYLKNSTYINKELQSMIDTLIDNPQIISKVQLFAPKPYTYRQFNKWQHKYSDIPSIQEKLKKIEEHLESHLITAGMTKNPAFPIFLLKNHYGYSDKKEIETETTHVFKVARGNRVIDIQPAQVKQILNKSKAPNKD